jgi:hypothetical protein
MLTFKEKPRHSGDGGRRKSILLHNPLRSCEESQRKTESRLRFSADGLAARF